ncbi:unnamed protein product [Arctogadus glacialis]
MAVFEGLSRKHGFKISTTFPCSVEDCSLAVVREKGDNVTEPAESVEAGPSSAAAEQSDSEGGLMEEEDSRCKAPLLKRKPSGSETCGSKAKKTADGEEKEVQTESSGEERTV